MKKSLFIFIIFMIIMVVAAFFLISYAYQYASTNNTTNFSSSNNSKVQISGYEFSPSSITIKVVDTVTWTNMDATPHTVTSDTGNELDSPILASGSTYSHIFKSSGNYDYHSSLDQNLMKGEIIVQ
jgi:plastocyanin